MTRPLVLYHGPACADGFCSAWVAHRKFGDSADYIPVQYGTPPPDVTGREVFILDFSYKRPVLLEMAEKAKRIIILDHHKSAMEDLLEGLKNPKDEPYEGQFVDSACPVAFRFNMNKSGARLAWEFFFPDEPAPWLVAYTEDRDLWRFKLDDSRAVSAFIASHPFDFKLWEEWANRHYVRTQYIDDGNAILRYQAHAVERICENAIECDVYDHSNPAGPTRYSILAVNTCILISEVAGRLAEGRAFGAAWFIRADGKKQWSLRSTKEGIDVAAFAARHGGGGHVRAAGYEEDP